jgi:hypothetical protein
MSTRFDAGHQGAGRPPAIVWFSWVWVVVPFLYGIYFLFLRIPALFGG